MTGDRDSLRAVITPEGAFNSVVEAARHFGVNPRRIRARCRRRTLGWCYAADERGPKLERTPIGPRAKGRLSPEEKRYRAHLSGAKQRGIPFELTFEQWWEWWQIDNRWERRGRGRGLVMARKEDIGPYSIENIYCATGVQNTKDVAKPARQRAGKQAWATFCERGQTSHLTCREKHPNNRQVQTPAGVFPSAALAAEHHGINHDAARKRARSGLRWRYVDAAPEL